MNQDFMPTPQLFAYLEKCSVKESTAQKQLREQVSHLDLSVMQISPLQGQFLKFLLTILKPKKCLELGTYCGYSALLMAESIADDAHLYTCDIKETVTNIAKQAWLDAGVNHKISLILQPAVKTMMQFIKSEPASFDFIFIDADKTNYTTYYLMAKDLLKSGGTMIIDNIAWEGKVANSKYQDRQTKEIRNCNQLIMRDHSVTSCIVPLGDGMFLIHKN